MKNDLTYQSLVQAIRDILKELAHKADRAINISLTLRNWLFGFYIAEFEMNGLDRAKYGEKLLQNLSTTLKKHDISGTG